MRSSILIKLGGIFSVLFVVLAVWGANNFPNLSTNQLTVTGATATTVPYFDASKILVSSAVTPTQLGFVATATSANTVSTLVKRDGSGNFSAGTITATLTGNVTGAVTGNASTATALAADPADCSANTYATTIAATGALTCASITNASTTAVSTNTPSTIVLRDGSGNFAAGTITANLTGNASGSSGSTTGNAATATALASDPSDCASDTYANAIAASGNLSCVTVTNAGLAGSIAASKLIGSDIATVGTITSGTWSGTTIALNKGGTGQTTKQAAFDALSPLTTAGDTLVYASGHNDRVGTVLGDAGLPWLSGGGIVPNAWTLLGVIGGGTGRATLTNHGVLVGAGITAISQTSTGTNSGTLAQLLASGGSSADPDWTVPQYPITSGSAGKVLVSNGTNIIYSTPTYPTTATNGSILVATSTNGWASSVTPTIGVAGTSTGTVTLAGVTSGGVTIQPQSAAGTWNFNLPITAGSAGQVLTSQGGGSTAMTWGDGGGGTGINFVTNGTGEVDTTGWATYADAAAVTPVDGTAGSPTVTWTQSASSPLRGSGSFLFTKDAANRQGNGASYAFTIATSSEAKVQKIEFDYVTVSGTFVAGSSGVDSDIEVYVYDVTNAVLIQPSTYKLFTSTTSPPSHFSAYFQTASNSTSYRLIFHTATTSASAYVVKFDDISVGPSQYIYGSPVTDMVSWTPTYSTGLGTVTTNNARWYREGQFLVADLAFASGTATAAVASFSLPAGLTLDTANMNQNFVAGSFGATNTPFTGTWFTQTGTATNLIYFSSTAASVVTAASGNAWANATNFIGKIRVPIAGWGSSVQMSTDNDQRAVSFEAYSAGNQTSIGTNNSFVKITHDSVTYDTHAAFDTTNKRYVIPVSGYYNFSYALTMQGTNVLANGYGINFYVNGASFRVSMRIIASAGNAFILSGQSPDLKLNAGDYVEIFLYGAGNNSVSTLSTSGAAANTWFSGRKVTGPSSIGATETIAARYFAATATITGSNSNVTYTTKDYDTHGAYSGATYTIPAAGKYHINAGLQVGGTYAATNATAVGIFKNGTEIASNTSVAGGASGLQHPMVSDIINCVAGDLITIKTLSSATSPVVSASNFRNYFSIVRVGL